MGDSIKIWLLGAENPDSIRGMYLDHAIMDEFASMNPVIWSQVVRPALSDRLGKAMFIGTPQGENHFFDIYNAATSKELADWHGLTLTVDDTKLIPDAELESSRLTMTEDEFNQEFMCSFTAALTGAYFSKYLEKAEEEGRLCHVPHNPMLPVATFWDLGISDNMAIWFAQKVGQAYHFIDYLEYAGKGIEFYIDELNKKPYNYARHHFPHDVKKREYATGKERRVVFQELGLRPIVAVPKVNNKAEIINASRLAIPMCCFDKDKCQDGLRALKNYQRKYDPKTKKYADKPIHDWTCHAADAFGTFAMGRNDGSFLAGIENVTELPKEADSEYNELE